MIGVEGAQPESERRTTPARLAGFFLLVAILPVMPALVLVVAFDQRSRAGPQDALHVPTVLWALWGLFSLWITFDASRFLRIIRETVDPLGTEALGLALGGAVNLGVLVVALFFGLF